MGSENASFQLPKSSGCRPNLREWWVGEKISLDNDERPWIVDCIRQSKKSNEHSSCLIRGGKFESGSCHGVPAQKKRFVLPLGNVWLTRVRISGQFLDGQTLRYFKIPSSHFHFTSLIVRERGHHELCIVLTAIFSAATGDFPCRGKTHCAWNATHRIRCHT